MLLVVILIALLILLYFAFFTGKSTPAPELYEDIHDPVIVEATVVDKQIATNMRSKSRDLIYGVTFHCDDGESREFFVDKKTYDELNADDKDTLVYLDNQFFGFGDHGATEAGFAGAVNDDGFTHEDFDESIDIELYPGMEERSALSEGDRKDLELFKAAKKLSAKTESFKENTGSLPDYPSTKLLEKVNMYPFLKSEPRVISLISNAYKEALSDMYAFEGDARQGVAADSVFINKNEFRVLVRLQEAPKPLEHTIYFEFSANE